MRKALKFFHTLASCGLIGALLGYMLVLVYAPHDTPAKFADMRQTIGVLCNYLLLPSLGIALITGLLSMAVHRPFQEKRWAWMKALLGLSMFESTLAIIQSKANYAAVVAAKMASGEVGVGALKIYALVRMEFARCHHGVVDCQHRARCVAAGAENARLVSINVSSRRV